MGGQTPPILKTGAKLEWKKPQKKAKKNITSETINKSTPSLKPFWTTAVWWPSKVASRIISLHHVYITYRIIENPVKNSSHPPMNLCMYNTKPVVNENAPREATKGHGLGSTKWYEW